MTGKDMLQGIQNLDAELIEESEFGTFGRGKARGFGKKKLLLILAAALIMATMTAGSGHHPLDGDHAVRRQRRHNAADLRAGQEAGRAKRPVPRRPPRQRTERRKPFPRRTTASPSPSPRR